MKNICLVLILLALITGCQSGSESTEKSGRDLETYFSQMPAPDVLRFEILDESEMVAGDTIPNRFFFSQMETRLMNGIEYFDNSGELKVIGRFHFPLTEDVKAYLVEIRQNWYRNQSLFLYDANQQDFVQRVTVAEFYGGEGGQILGGSWLVDIDSDGQKDLVKREIEHWILIEEDGSVRDTLAEKAMLMRWDSNRFTEAEVHPDSLSGKYPIRSMW